ncbi:hypothetical protein HMPREF1144_0483 [Klebsiella sp. OBRC7]|nr:hypothetical protein HMPREF1144_0483 [Klebsiella sp. OBRC7]
MPFLKMDTVLMILSRVSVDMWYISGMVFIAPGVCICLV